ncbi:MAG: magnesium transporter [Acidiferrobacterales bacterium]|nr:magnesium transporter [Acidiferrobacterales bacterium]
MEETYTDKTETLVELQASLAQEDLAAVRALIEPLHPADISGLLASLPTDKRKTVFSQIPLFLTGEVLLELPESIRADLVAAMDHESIVAAAQSLDTDDIADLLPELPDEVIAQILFSLDKQDRQRLEAVLPYPEDTAGGLMDVDAITVRENITVEVVFRYLRMRGELPEGTNKLFVVDRADRLIGTLLLGPLLTSDPGMRVGQIMDHDPVKFDAMTSDKEVAAAFQRYNLISAPVVGEDGHLLGRITVDDVVDVMREEAARSVMAPAGLSEQEDIFAPVARSSRNRALWLGINLVTAVLASWVIGFFESTIEKVVALAVLMPIVASMGGNAGTQTVVLVVRGLAMGNITHGNTRRVLMKELAVGIVNSLLWAIAVAGIVLIWYRSPLLAGVIAIAMVVNLVFAALSGVLIPLALRRAGVDPAIASGVILTTVTDVVGFLAFLGLAALVLA